MQGPREFDIVTLTEPAPRRGLLDDHAGGMWPTGAEGTLLDPPQDGYGLVEISDDTGRGLDLIRVLIENLRATWRPGVGSLAAAAS
jgi:hypothetical protein